MADNSPSGDEFARSQNEQLDEPAPILPQNEDDEDEDGEDLASIGEPDSEGDEEEDQNEDEEEDEDEDDDGGYEEGSEWSATQIDGLFCPICIRPWTSGDGDHYICCLPCGHIYGMSCIQTWLEKCQNRGKCPHCKKRCSLKDVRKLFASQVVAIDDEAQKRIQSLENKCASLERKRARLAEKEAKWRKIEAELRMKVKQHEETIIDVVSSPSIVSRVDNQKLRKCQEILDAMDVDTDLNESALSFLVKKPNWCGWFLNMDDEMRKAFLRIVVTQPPRRCSKLLEFVKILQAMDLGSELNIKASMVVRKKPNWCDLFLSMDNEKRLRFISNVVASLLPPPPPAAN